METSAIGATAATQNVAAPRAATPQEAAAKSSGLSSDFETFLRMLTVQLQNQDPLNPVEAADYAVQLATFSGVEQQVKTNDLLGALGDRLNLMGLSQFAGWVGMTARYTGPVGFSGAPVAFSARPDATADAAWLVVRDAGDQIVDRRQIPVQGGELTWSGLAGDGNPFPNGQYSLFVESQRNGATIGTVPAEVFDAVAEASVQDGAARIVMAGGNAVDPAVVSGLRGP